MTFSRSSKFAAGLFCAALLGCDKRSLGEMFVPPPRPPVAYVTIAPITATLRLGDTLRFVAAVPGPPGPATALSWTSSDATKVTVDSTGLARAVAAPTPGIVICATLKADAGSKGCATIVIQVQ
ncbi:MAG: Ig-like domain-containing protein [Gemmatimonadaceae bacterium]